MRNLVFATAIATLWATAALAGDACSAPAACDLSAGCDPGCCDPGLCDRCGCQKKCQVVCEMKKVKKTVWVVECEDFCAPLPRCGRGGDPCCDPGCGADPAACANGACGQCAACSCDPCTSLECRDYVPPKCGKVRTKKNLVKKEIECEIPVYKCVVVCSGCNDPGFCDPGACAPAACGAPTGEAAPAPATTRSAPMPPVIGTSYVK